MVMTDTAPVKNFAIRVAQVGSWVALYGDGSGRSDLKRFVAEVERRVRRAFVVGPEAVTDSLGRTKADEAILIERPVEKGDTR